MSGELAVSRQPARRSVRSRPCRRTIVVGGGLGGLVVAYRRMLAGDDVTLLEASGRLGGQLWTEVEDGFVVEHGAEGFPTGSDVIRRLAAELDLSDRIVGQRVTKSYGFDGRTLYALESGEAAARLGLRAQSGQHGQGIASFRWGMGELVSGLVLALLDRVEIHLDTPVRYLAATDSGWEVETGTTSRFTDQVVLATSSRVAGGLLTGIVDDAGGLERAPALSSATVSLAFERSALERELDGTGFVASESVSLADCRACTFSSAKLPGRCPDDHALLRLFFRPSRDELRTLSDHSWTERAQRVLERVSLVKGAPVRAWVDRWPSTMAVVSSEQRHHVATIERRWGHRGLLLAGGAFHGPGIDGAVRSAEAAAATLDTLRRAS